MPGFPSQGASLNDLLTECRQMARGVKTFAQFLRADLAARSVPGSQILALLPRLKQAREVFIRTRDTAGMAAYAQAQLGQDVATTFSAMLSEVDATGAWVISSFPRAGGYLARETMAADGTISERMFTPAETAGLVAKLDALIATID